MSASSSGRQGDTKKEDVKDTTGFRCGTKGRKATYCSAPQPNSFFRAQTGFAVFGGLSISPPLVLWQALALDSPAAPCPAEAATAHATRAQRAHRLVSSEA